MRRTRRREWPTTPDVSASPNRPTPGIDADTGKPTRPEPVIYEYAGLELTRDPEMKELVDLLNQNADNGFELVTVIRTVRVTPIVDPVGFRQGVTNSPVQSLIFRRPRQ